MPWGTFKLSELKLDQENIRTGEQPDQRSALRALIADQKQKLVNLAIDILSMGGLSPGEPVWVTEDPSDPGKQIVLEGNRRVAALKLMENPRLAEGTEVAVGFAELAKKFAADPIRQLEAQVFASRDAAWPWLQRRHMGAASGVALQRWRSLAKERAEPGWSGRVRRSLMVLDYLDDDTEEFGEVGNVIEAKSTTVDRVLNNPAMRDVLGVNIDPKTRTITFDNGDEIGGRIVLRNLISEMAKPEFKFSRIRDESDRKAFIGEFASGSVRKGGAPKDSPKEGKAETVNPRRTRVTDPVRATLAPKSGTRVFKVPGVRLNRLYRECRDIKLIGNENAAGLLLRVFIELSSEAYLIEKKTPIPLPLALKKGKTDWSEIGISLDAKINAVLPLIDTTARTKQQLKKARVALATTHATGSIHTLHAYFHNLEMNPDEAGLRDGWDTWENYLALLHAART